MKNPLSTLLKQALSIYSDINKVPKQSFEDDDQVHILQRNPEEDSTEEELISLAKLWKDAYQDTYGEMEKKQKVAYDYWLGKQKPLYTDNIEDIRRVSTNVIFEATETFLPAATKNNPEAFVVLGAEDPMANQYRDLLAELINSQSKIHGVKFQLRESTRDWLINYIGVIGISWDFEKDNFEICKISPKRMIFDTEGKVLWNGLFKGRYLGVVRTMTADRIRQLFPKAKKYIDALTLNNGGTNVDVIEWWTTEVVFFTDLDCKHILTVMPYPHWNSDDTEVKVDEFGTEYEEMNIGYNFFKTKEFPFIFIKQLSTGKKIFDETSLIEQAMGPQDILTKRTAQADYNADAMNNGYTVSGEYFQKEDAAEFGRALAAGDVAFIPQKTLNDSQYDIAQAYKREQAAPLPADIYTQIQIAKTDIRSIFGTFGMTPESQQQEKTVRGKVVLAESDGSRIGGGIVEVLETVSATLYTWMLQMMYVYYDDADYIDVLGKEKATLFLSLQPEYLDSCPQIFVKEGSTLPKNPIVAQNQAIDLFQMGAIDPITLYDKMGFPNPLESFKNLLLYQTNPMALLTGQDPSQALMQPQPMQPQQASPPGAVPENSGGGNDEYPSTLPPLTTGQTASMGGNNL